MKKHSNSQNPRRHTQVVLSEKEIQELLRYAVEEYHPPRALPHFAVILATLALTGAREREVLGLRVQDLDLREGRLHIRPTQSRPLKTQRDARTIRVDPKLLGMLRTYMAWPERDPQEWLFPVPPRVGDLEWASRLLRRACSAMPMPHRLRSSTVIMDEISGKRVLRSETPCLRSSTLRRSWLAAQLRKGVLPLSELKLAQGDSAVMRYLTDYGMHRDGRGDVENR